MPAEDVMWSTKMKYLQAFERKGHSTSVGPNLSNPTTSFATGQREQAWQMQER